MKAFQKLLLTLSVIVTLFTVVVLMIQWKKDGEIWRSIKKSIARKDLFKLS